MISQGKNYNGPLLAQSVHGAITMKSPLTDLPGVLLNSVEDTSCYRVRVKSNVAGALFESSDVRVSNGDWATNTNIAPKNYQLAVLYSDPSRPGTPWDRSLLDTAQIGVRPTGTGPNLKVSQMWVLVGFDTSWQVPYSKPARKVFLTRRWR